MEMDKDVRECVFEIRGALQDIAEELKRLADFFIATQKAVPEKRGSTKKFEKKKGVVVESIEAPIFRVTAKAVGIKGEDNLIAWIPKRAIENLDKIVVENGAEVELKLADWFKLEWKEDKYND